MSEGGYFKRYAVIAAAPVLIRAIILSLINVMSRYATRNLPNWAWSRPYTLSSTKLRRLAALHNGKLNISSIIIIANAVALVLHAKSIRDVASRSGVVATVNLGLLLAGSQLDIVASIQGDSLRSQLMIHRCLSAVTLVTATLHVLAVMLGEKMPLAFSVIWGLTVSEHPATYNR